MSDFVHSDVPQVAVINTPEGSVMVEQNDSSFARPEDAAEEVKPEDIEVPEAVPYRASTPESDKENVDILLKEGKITKEEHTDRVKEIEEIAKDPTVSPQEPEPEPEPKAASTHKAEKEELTTKDTAKK